MATHEVDRHPEKQPARHAAGFESPASLASRELCYGSAPLRSAQN